MSECFHAVVYLNAARVSVVMMTLMTMRMLCSAVVVYYLLTALFRWANAYRVHDGRRVSDNPFGCQGWVSLT